MSPHRNDPQHRGSGAGAKVNGTADHLQSSTGQRPALVSRITIDLIAEVYGQSYMDGPFGCLACRRHTTLNTCVIVNDRLAHCGQCGRDWTISRLRRAVTEDPQLARRLRALMEVTL